MAVINGTEGDDSLHGTVGDDIIYGLAGDDLLIFGEGRDQLYGGNGDDIVRFSHDDNSAGSSFAGTVDGGDGYDILDLRNIIINGQLILQGYQPGFSFSDGNTVTVSNFEEILLENPNGYKNISVGYGAEFSKVFTGSGNDIISGNGKVSVNLQGGDDRYTLNRPEITFKTVVIDGGAGEDFFAVGPDYRVFPYTSYIVDLQEGTAINQGGFVCKIFNFENVILIGDGYPSQVFGDDGANIFYVEYDQIGLVGLGAGALMDGRGGDDTIFGSEFNDTLIGENGHDYLSGGSGSDSLTGGDGNDHIFGQSVNGGDDGADFLSGGGGGDYLQGNMGNDTLDGGTGADRIQGGRDDDLIFGGEGSDSVNGNLGNDTVDGGAGNDWLRGGRDDDLIGGGDGNDILLGDKGHDTLTGGAGTDLFIFAPDDAQYSGSAAADFQFDEITDFACGIDKLNIGSGFSSFLMGHKESIESAIGDARLHDLYSINNYIINGENYIIYASDHQAIDSIIKISTSGDSPFLDIADFIIY